MGLTRTDIYTTEQNKIASLAKALGHPARIAILQHLLKVKSCICGDIVSEIGLSQPTISQHLKEMKKVGLIKGTIDGVKMCYCVDSNVLKEVKQSFNNLLAIDMDAACC